MRHLASKNRAVLFDLDGTLIDSEPGIVASFGYAFTQLGRSPPSLETVRASIGKQLRLMFAEILGSNDDRLLDSAVAFYREHYLARGMFEARVSAGIPDALRDLRAWGFRTRIATAKNAETAKRTVEHFELARFFDGVHGCTEKAGAPDKIAIIRGAMTAGRLRTYETVMVGDTEHDVNGARSCGIACLGVSYGYRSEKRLRAAGAFAVARMPTDIVREVELFFAQ